MKMNIPEEVVELARRKVRTDAMDRFLEPYLTEDAREFIAGFAARAALEAALPAILARERSRARGRS